MQLEAQYDCRIAEKDEKLGLTQNNGQLVVPPKYKYIGEIDAPLVIVGKGDFELNSHNQLMDVGKRSSFGVYNMEREEEVIPCKFNWVSIKNKTSILVYSGSFDTEYGHGLEKFYTSGNGLGLFDISGRRLAKCNRSYIDNRTANAIVMAEFETKKNHWRVEVAIEDTIWRFTATTEDANVPLPLFRLSDATGEPLNTQEFNFIGPFSEGLAVACQGRYYGCDISYDNQVSIDLFEGKMGYIDTTGQVVIPVFFDKAQSFKNGKARVEKEGREYYIDKNGEEIK